MSYKYLFSLFASILLLPIIYFLFYEDINNKLDYLIPCFFVILLYFLFVIYIIKKTENNIISDIGLIYVSFMVLYTIAPAINIISGMNELDPILLLSPSINQLSAELWRQFAFILTFIFGYTAIRKNSNLRAEKIDFSESEINRSVFIFICILFFINLYLILMSAPVENYYESYTRYENLPWVLKKIASVFIRFKIGIYTILLTLLFINYKKFKLAIPIFILLICLFELFYTHGARIQVLIIVIQSVCLYSILVSKISIKKIALISFLFITIFMAIEIVRLIEFKNIDDLIDVLENINLQLPWELNSVFYTGLHLYMERTANTIPAVEWPMFFFDLISIFTFNDFLLWNPTDWYYRNYHPNAPVAPFTLSPIADSAIWGGYIDLIFRGILNGCFFALIFNLYVDKKKNLSILITYIFLCSMSIITFKYSIFYLLTPFVKNLFPCLLLMIVINKFKFFNKKIPKKLFNENI